MGERPPILVWVKNPSPVVLLHKVAPPANGCSWRRLQELLPCGWLLLEALPLGLLWLRRSMQNHGLPALLLPMLMCLLGLLLRLLRPLDWPVPTLLLPMLLPVPLRTAQLLLRNLPAVAMPCWHCEPCPILAAKWALRRLLLLLLISGRPPCCNSCGLLPAPPRFLLLLAPPLAAASQLPSAGTAAALVLHNALWHRHRASDIVILQRGRRAKGVMSSLQAEAARGNNRGPAMQAGMTWQGEEASEHAGLHSLR